MKHALVLISLIVILLASSLVSAGPPAQPDDGITVTEPVMGTAPDWVDAIVLHDGDQCALRAEDRVLAVARSSEGIVAYTSAENCEGLIVVSSSLINWDDLIALNDLPFVQVVLTTQEPDFITDAPADFREKCRDPGWGGSFPPGGPPYTYYYSSNGLGYSSMDEWRATKQSGIDLLVCTETLYVTVDTCYYTSSTASRTVSRVRHDLRIKLVNYETGLIAASYDVRGEDPPHCTYTITGNTFSFSGKTPNIVHGLSWLTAQLSGTSLKTTRTQVATQTLNARSEPNTNSEILSQLTYQTPVNLIARNEDGSWVVALLPDMTQAWLFTELVSVASATEVMSLPVADGPAADVPIKLRSSSRLALTSETVATDSEPGDTDSDASIFNWSPIIQDFDGVAMALVPAGCFRMGSTEPEYDYAVDLCLANESDEETCQGYYLDERPAHEQCFDEPFWIDVYEVTNDQFQQYGGEAAVDTPVGRATYPRESISQIEARDFCAQRGGRLPTEAEWEYAARGPYNLIFPWGNEFDGSRLNYQPPSGASSQIRPVGSYESGASWVGALDMAGNVVEWVSTQYQAYPFTIDGGLPDRESYVLRGGGWFMWPEAARSAARLGVFDLVEGWYGNTGFRCVRDVQADDQITASPSDESVPTPTPTPTVAAPAAVEVDSFTEDFSTNQHHWHLQEGTVIEDGTLQLTVPEAGVVVAAIVPDQARSDFDLTVDILSATTGSYQYGVWFRGTDGFANGYYFVIDPESRHFALLMGRNDEWQADVISWQYAAPIMYKAVNTLRIVAAGSRITLYINDVQVSLLQDDTLQGGEIMLVVGSYDDAVFPVTARFDNLVIRPIPGE
ncbi:MAG: SUMF1/EgtB/PvdO family nonheme iron enzyme [Anaerolineae bacterium]|nr:SUMF1/EgtB/PvdO family nonheme iron enzyme [Anaerolineae bacterium]